MDTGGLKILSSWLTYDKLSSHLSHRREGVCKMSMNLCHWRLLHAHWYTVNCSGTVEKLAHVQCTVQNKLSPNIGSMFKKFSLSILYMVWHYPVFKHFSVFRRCTVKRSFWFVCWRNPVSAHWVYCKNVNVHC